jgi:hypothetical protein
MPKKRHTNSVQVKNTGRFLIDSIPIGNTTMQDFLGNSAVPPLVPLERLVQEEHP